MMGIDAFAEQLLFGRNLSDKLLAVSPFVLESLSDNSSYVSSAQNTFLPPKFPGRPPELDFERSSRLERQKFPTLSAMENAQARGRVLHFFANHELLAIELMALTLLKFPEAPLSFRRGLVRTIGEEQAHMLLYIERMSALGVEFGENPINGFFWNLMQNMQSPMDYAVRMSMTFEQANLDYSRHYQEVFARVGDDLTSELLKRVYEDEIGHVKFGLQWFRSWREPELDDWTAFEKRLVVPLSPSRAKGAWFDRDGRLAAGFDEAFVTKLETYSQSKGRPARVYMFNPAFERELLSEVPITPSRIESAIQNDFGSQMMFIASSDDVILVQKNPSTGFKKYLSDAGFEIPEFLEASSSDHRKFGALHPWGLTATSAALLKSFREKSVDQEKWSVRLENLQNGLLRKVASKNFSSEVMRDFYDECGLSQPEQVLGCKSLLAVSVSSWVEILNHIDLLAKSGSKVERWVIKDPWAASGRGHVFIDGAQLNDANMVGTLNKKIEQLLKKHGVVTLEPWLDRVADFSVQVDVDAHSLRCHGPVRLLCDGRGAYRGHIVQRYLCGFEEGLVKAICGNEVPAAPWREFIVQAAQYCGQRLQDLGYVGPAGIDVFIFQTPLGYRLRPIVEINPRYTMGRLALALEDHVAKGRVGLWYHLRRADMTAQGFSSWADFLAHLESQHPLQLTTQGKHFISGGILATSDPSLAGEHLSVLVVGKNLATCMAVIGVGYAILGGRSS